LIESQEDQRMQNLDKQSDNIDDQSESLTQQQTSAKESQKIVAQSTSSVTQPKSFKKQLRKVKNDGNTVTKGQQVPMKESVAAASMMSKYGSIVRLLYKPFTPMPDLSKYVNSFIEVRIHKCYLSRANKAVTARNFQGSD